MTVKRQPKYKKPQTHIRLDCETVDDLRAIANLLGISVAGLIRQYTRQLKAQVENARTEAKHRAMVEGLCEIALDNNTPPEPEAMERKKTAAGLLCISAAAQKLGVKTADAKVIQVAIDDVNARDWDDPAYKDAILEFLDNALDGAKNPLPKPVLDERYQTMIADQWRRYQAGEKGILDVMKYECELEPDKFAAALATISDDALIEIFAALPDKTGKAKAKGK